nr:hypothetical protein [Pedobacter panaciterrae]
MKNKPFLILVAICFLSFIIVNIYFLVKGNKKNLAYEFSGIVEEVNYDVKGTPYVTVDHIMYYLSEGWDFEHLIEKGDSIKKRKTI